MYSSAFCNCDAPVTALACLTTKSAPVVLSTAPNTVPKLPSPSLPFSFISCTSNFFSNSSLSTGVATYASNAPAKKPGLPVAQRNTRQASKSSFSASPVNSVNPLVVSSLQNCAICDCASFGRASNTTLVTGNTASASAFHVPGTSTPNTTDGRSGNSSAYPGDAGATPSTNLLVPNPRSPTPQSARFAFGVTFTWRRKGRVRARDVRNRFRA
mmetsp:Transcript_2977/g.10445  ORF Transcript_2977/g.10445 Transcript_2977/m.10445 type:complete len:213 (-) Transcript_2977:238-876(-)